jgi:hypothetical protein
LREEELGNASGYTASSRVVKRDRTTSRTGGSCNEITSTVTESVPVTGTLYHALTITHYDGSVETFTLSWPVPQASDLEVREPTLTSVTTTTRTICG